MKTALMKFVIKSLILLLSLNSFCQELPDKKVIYLLYDDYVSNCSDEKIKSKLKRIKKEGIQFNLCKKAVLINTDKMIRDTISSSSINDYKITNIGELDNLEKAWRNTNKSFFLNFKEKNGYPPPPLNKNDIFQLFVLEKTNSDQLYLYEVVFKNEEVVNRVN